MNRSLIRTFLFIIAINTIFNFNGMAQESSLTRESIENSIAKDNNFENIVLIIPNNFSNLTDYHIIAFQYDKSPKKIILTVRDNQGKMHLLKVSYDEAIIIPVPQTYIYKGKVIEEDDIIQVKFPKNRKNSNLVVASEEMVGKVARKNLPAGKFISLNDLSKPNVLSKGQTIKVFYTKGKLNIETKGVAVQSGGMGDYIDVKSLDSNKIISGKIVSSDAVKIEAR